MAHPAVSLGLLLPTRLERCVTEVLPQVHAQ
jgi:hypothetical protein